MRLLARGTLRDFVTNGVGRKEQAAVQAHFNTLCLLIKKATWKNSAELKAQHRAASIISSSRVVFNVKGNDYRLVVSINYVRQIGLVLWIGTHKEYDRIDVREVTYDKRRYSNPSNQE